MVADPVDTILDKICKEHPDVVGFSCYVWNIREILCVSSLLKKRDPNIQIILGGPEVTPCSLETITANASVDVIVRGEGEETFRELADHYAGCGKDLCDIQGITYRRLGEICETADREPIKDLDSIPSPYLLGLVKPNTKNEFPLETSRGCRYRCHFCYYHKGQRGIRNFSMKRVEEDLEFLLSNNIAKLYIIDSTFNTNRDRAIKILKLIVKYNMGTKIHLELKAELLDEEMIRLIKAANVNYIEIGIQSVNPKTLKAINRHFDRRGFERNVRSLNENHLPFEIQLIDGLPGDNFNSIKAAVDYLCDISSHSITIMRFMLLHGTFLRNNADKFGITYEQTPPYRSLSSSTFSHADILKTHRLMFACDTLYNKRLMRHTLEFLRRKLDAKYTWMFSLWIEWLTKTLNMPLSRIELVSGSKRNRINKRIIQSEDKFASHLCYIMGRKDLMPIASELARFDQRLFILAASPSGAPPKTIIEDFKYDAVKIIEEGTSDELCRPVDNRVIFTKTSRGIAYNRLPMDGV